MVAPHDRSVDYDRVQIARVARLCAALGHPLRIRIVALLASPDTRLSPTQLADQLEAPLGNVAYHVRALAKARLLKQAGRRQVRGAVEHFYTLASDGEHALRITDQLAGRAR